MAIIRPWGPFVPTHDAFIGNTAPAAAAALAALSVPPAKESKHGTNG
jgi:hypothetical protein